MKNMKLKFSFIITMIGLTFFFFASKNKANNIISKTHGVYNENAFNYNANPYVGVKLPKSDDVYVEVAPKKQNAVPANINSGRKIYFSPGSFDNKRMDTQVVKNQRLTAKALQRNELKLIEKEIRLDEIKIQELLQKGDNENTIYLENLIAQKKARYEELKYE